MQIANVEEKVVFDEVTLNFLLNLSPSTRKVYRRGLTLFQKFYGKPLANFLNEVERDRQAPLLQRKHVATSILNRFIRYLLAQRFSPKSISSYVSAVQSLARFYEIPIDLRYVQKPSSRPVSRKFAWTVEDVMRFVDVLKKPIMKSIAISIFQSGLSLSDLLNIKFGDIIDELKSGKLPVCIDLSRKKTDVPFLTFFGTWAVLTFEDYIASTGKKRFKLKRPIYPVSARTVEEHFAKAAQKFIGKYEHWNPCRPHSLRAAFHTILRDHKVDPLYVEFWMGHKLPEHNRVYISKSKEGWRQTYREQAEPWLTPESLKHLL